VTNALLADDMDIFRAGVARLLMMEEDLRIAAWTARRPPSRARH
jgi:hypothetical protein